ncbi:hypothetical protein EON64_06960 [archaeon]|nr:MAG: hypothetical protein EON64_06960 [archaeon]
MLFNNQNPEDLRLFAGETLIVLEKHDHGWWLGSVDRTGEVHKGYFPKNYVKERPKQNPAPAPPPRGLRPLADRKTALATPAGVIQRLGFSKILRICALARLPSQLRPPDFVPGISSFLSINP